MIFATELEAKNLVKFVNKIKANNIKNKKEQPQTIINIEEEIEKIYEYIGDITQYLNENNNHKYK